MELHSDPSLFSEYQRWKHRNIPIFRQPLRFWQPYQLRLRIWGRMRATQEIIFTIDCYH